MIEPDDLPPPYPLNRPLTVKQSGIAACLVEGMTDKGIARATGLTVRTVESQKLAMVRKWGLNNNRELLVLLARMT